MNLATALKTEIARVARKEIKGETQQLKKASVQYRADIAALKRRVADLERAVSKLAKNASVKAVPSPEVDQRPLRMTFNPSRLAAQRKRLGLSAQELGALIGVSGQSLYKWEQGKAKPRAAQLIALRGIRSLGKREAAEKLAGVLESA
jgi:DNA-binding transcriptional regulator YiaG